MIEFLQDYTTKSLPPEHFEKGQQVERSPESEMYFVRSGVAGLVHDGVLVDEEYRPIVRTTLVEVLPAGDRRFAGIGGRGGEVIGLDAPQRASTGPGNAVVFGTADTELSQVEFTQLGHDLAASTEQFEAYRATSGEQITTLTNDVDRLTSALESARSQIASGDQALASAKTRAEDAASRVSDLESQLGSANSQIAELETQLAAANARADASQVPPVAEQETPSAEGAAAAGKSGRGK